MTGHDQAEGTPPPSQLHPSTAGSTLLEDAASLQSSPSLQPPTRVGAALHRQRLAGGQAGGSDQSGSTSSNSGHVVPARFQAGQLGTTWQHNLQSVNQSIYN